MVQHGKICQCNPQYKQTEKRHIIISLEAEKAFDKIQHHFTVNVLERAEIQGTYLNIMKAIYSKPTANMKLNGEKLKENDSTKIRNKKRLSILSVSIQHSTQSSSYSDKTTKRDQGDTIGKEVSLSLFVDDMIVYICDPKNSSRELLQLIKTFSNMIGLTINSKKNQ